MGYFFVVFFFFINEIFLHNGIIEDAGIQKIIFLNIKAKITTHCWPHLFCYFEYFAADTFRFWCTGLPAIGSVVWQSTIGQPVIVINLRNRTSSVLKDQEALLKLAIACPRSAASWYGKYDFIAFFIEFTKIFTTSTCLWY